MTVVLLADGFEEVEALTPVDYLRRAGGEVKLLAVDDCADEAAGGYVVYGARQVPVLAEEKLCDYLKNMKTLPDCVFVPGGMPGTKNVAACKEAISFIQQMNDAGKLVSAICAAPALVLSKAGVTLNRRWTCYPGMRDDAGEEIAATHVDGVPFVTDGNVVTGRGAGAAEQFAMELVRILLGQEKSDAVKAATCQR